MKTLKEIREEKGVKQLAVADALHIARQTYARYEENPRVMPIGAALDACAFLGCDFAEVSFES